jgi:hypothetical protein
MNGSMQLRLHENGAEPSHSFEVTDLRISGGAIFDPLDHGLIAVFSRGHWRHRGHLYRSISIAGECCLFFGITREPTFVSEAIGLFSLIGGSFRANGVEFAQYAAEQDTWRGVLRPMGWSVTRVIGAAAAVGLLVEPGISLLNPWDPLLQTLEAS